MAQSEAVSRRPGVTFADRCVLWVAQGFGLGRIPVTPGSFGSLLGLLWVALLLWPGRPWVYAVGTLAGLAASVWLCGAAERILRQTDPGSVVLDEVAAMPICCVSWVLLFAHQHHGVWLEPRQLMSRPHWIWLVGIFIAFRVFDIAKPWPVRQSQSLPGGWGVTVDDVLAAGYVNVVVLIAWGVGAPIA